METVKQNKQLMEIWDAEENKKKKYFPRKHFFGKF